MTPNALMAAAASDPSLDAVLALGPPRARRRIADDANRAAVVAADTAMARAVARSAASLGPRLVKDSARMFARRPALLENVAPGLASASSADMIRIGREVARRERRRWSPAPVQLINATAVVVLGRAMRRAEARRGRL